jgi:formate--tetrahydrofolate ligase
LGDALRFLGHKTCIALREPSLGPCFGVKGGATGGGYAQIIPMDDINLHFTGDIHAVGTANNLLAAAIDNHLYFGNELNFDLKRITWRRVVDLNDRALRNIVIGLGAKSNGVVRETGFDIAVASEIMAVLCLSSDSEDLKHRIDKIIVGYNCSGQEICCGDLKITGSIAALLKDAIKPNLVQTVAGTPALVHGGPFANIAHGCNSIIATKYALKMADYVVTEAGFGADLGAEKFLDIKCPLLGKYPDAVVIVATIRAIRLHATNTTGDSHGISFLESGFANLEKHIMNMRRYQLPVVVAFNLFPDDKIDEISYIEQRCCQLGVKLAVSSVWKDGARGGVDMANTVLEAIKCGGQSFCPLYAPEDSIFDKIRTLTETIYGASGVSYTPKAQRLLESANDDPIFRLYPICMAKTQYSLSDNKNLLGQPQDFQINIKDARLMAGAGFIVTYAGDIVTMPGLQKHPTAELVDVVDGRIIGLF